MENLNDIKTLLLRQVIDLNKFKVLVRTLQKINTK
jgi:hypothetical protein